MPYNSFGNHILINFENLIFNKLMNIQKNLTNLILCLFYLIINEFNK